MKNAVTRPAINAYSRVLRFACLGPAESSAAEMFLVESKVKIDSELAVAYRALQL